MDPRKNKNDKYSKSYLKIQVSIILPILIFGKKKKVLQLLTYIIILTFPKKKNT